MKVVGPILFVTAAGGVLGKVISSTSMVEFITSNAEVMSAIGIFFPFLGPPSIAEAVGGILGMNLMVTRKKTMQDF